MYKLFVCSAIFAVATCRPGVVFSSYSGLGGSSGGGHGLEGWSGGGSGGGGHGLEGWSGGGSGGGGGGGGEGDFHHGVSLVGGGGGGKTQTIDLTGHGDKHDGHFGGSFVASSKYSAGGHGGGGGEGGYGGHEGGGFEAHYSDVLGAGDDHSGGGGGGYEIHDGHY